MTTVAWPPSRDRRRISMLLSSSASVLPPIVFVSGLISQGPITLDFAQNKITGPSSRRCHAGLPPLCFRPASAASPTPHPVNAANPVICTYPIATKALCPPRLAS